MEDTPTRRDILDWIRAEHPNVSGDKARSWAEFLTGLEWAHLKPVVSIAANTGNHPSLVLSTAAAYSEDEVFKAAASAHLGRS